jgi:hypothetical protein
MTADTFRSGRDQCHLVTAAHNHVAADLQDHAAADKASIQVLGRRYLHPRVSPAQLCRSH